MAKRILLVCTTVIAAGLLGGIVSLIGNPISGDTWSHTFPNGSLLCLNSHQQPMAFRVDQVKSAGVITFGRCYYIWNRH